ncbi:MULTISPECIES: hypothetical protein [unclassified Microbacterium]|uniref:hypothetical protein n=1 Tax=unclassified Microbacterium TaxID=2609290 RepID=UPI0012FBA2EE|nr:hypothetical protein [Microbacterium sp. MAH-37]MVQ42961.1 hypothetical protein [Microbacterium sp. MAH-37]
MSAEKRTPPATHRGSSLGGLRAAANMPPEVRSERARKASEARWARENERRAAAGLPPTKKHRPEPSADDLEPWLEEVDRRYPDREWPNREARRREAIIIARTAAAEAAADAVRRRGDS